MSFLSALGKIGSLALDFIPGGGAAKTGVKVAKAIAKGASAAGDIGSVVGKQEEGEANSKVTQAKLNQQQDQNALASYIAQQNAQNSAAQTDLQRKGFETSNRSNVARQAALGALLGGGLQANKVGPGGASGGLLASLNSNPDALAALKTLASQGSAAQNSPLSFQGGQMLTAPKLTAVPQIDQGGIMSTLAKVAQIAGAASPYLAGIGKDNQQAPFVTASNGIYGDQLPGQQIAINPPKPKPVYADEEDWSNR